MKNKFILCTVLLLIFTLTACNNQDETKPDNPDTKASTETTANNNTQPQSNQTKTEINKSDYSELRYEDPSLRYAEDFIIDDSNLPEMGPPGITKINLQERKLVKFNNDNTQLKSSMAIEYINDKLYVVDQKNNCIAILDLDGNRIETWGQLGSKPGEFSSPKDIAYDDKNKLIYILDNSNNRVQVFNIEHQFIKEISLKKMKLASSKKYQNITVDNNKNIYITTTDAVMPKQRLCRISEKGNIYWYPGVFYGETAKYKNDIYSFDAYEVLIYRDEIKNKTGDSICAQGRSSLYKIIGDRKEKIYDFPNMYSPSCLCISNEDVYAYSSFHFTFDKFHIENNKLHYEYTMTDKIKYHNKFDIFDVSAVIVGNSIYIGERQTGELYKLSLNEVNDNEK